jgi:N utilization substance protein A
MKSDTLLAIGQLAAEKNLAKEVVFEAVEAALASAYRRDGDEAPNVFVRINPDTGEIHAYMQKTVVSDVEDANLEISLDEARRYKPSAKGGDVLDFEMKIPENAGRIAAQTAKQVVLQRLRDAERESVYEEYADKVGEIVVATVQRVEPRQTLVEIGRGTEAVLPSSEQPRNEHPRSGQRLKVVILAVEREAKGPPVVVSRTHRWLLRRLLESEVPEVANGTVTIKSVAREGGFRSKVAVTTRLQNIDPIGACVGMRGSRIQNIVNELNGERVDIIKWDPDPGQFVANALSPAQVVSVEADLEEHAATVVVPDSMLSLAIGKEGQNARLAARLTGWRITIQSESAAASETSADLSEAPSTFEPTAPGEELDVDLVAEPEMVIAAEPVSAPRPAPVTLEAVAESADASSAPAEEEISFQAALAQMDVPDREERESESYGEETEDDGEEYEVPTMVAVEDRPTAIRFAEDVLPKRDEEEDDAKGRKETARRKRRERDESEDDMEEIDYSGRIH